MKILSILSLLLVSACANNVTSEVTVLHKNPSFEQKTFAVSSSAQQLDSLEYVEYANKISDELEGLGMEFTKLSKADYIVSFDYGVSSGRTQIRSTPVNVGVGHYGGRLGGGFGVGFPVGGYGYDVDSYTEYTRFLDIDIRDNRKNKIYEAKVESVGRNDNYFAISKCLIAAAFQGFPQNSGSVNRVSIPAETCAK